MLGQHLLMNLQMQGHDVYSPQRSELDLFDSADTLRFIESLQPDAIIHTAAVVGGIQANIDGGGRFLTDNLMIDHSVIFGAKEAGVKNFVYIGSSCMYPANRQNPLSESDLLSGPLEPTNANYALAKIMGAKTVEAFDSNKDLNWKTFVASNLYGPGDHFGDSKSHLVAAIIFKVMKAVEINSETISMWGDGKVKREFTYVTDFAKWIAESVSNLNQFPSIMNVGYGMDFTVREYYEFVMKELRFKGDLVADLSMPSGNLRKLMDSSVAKGFGWNPSTTIEEGIKKTIGWLKESKENV